MAATLLWWRWQQSLYCNIVATKILCRNEIFSGSDEISGSITIVIAAFMRCISSKSSINWEFVHLCHKLAATDQNNNNNNNIVSFFNKMVVFLVPSLSWNGRFFSLHCNLAGNLKSENKSGALFLKTKIGFSWFSLH